LKRIGDVSVSETKAIVCSLREYDESTEKASTNLHLLKSSKEKSVQLTHSIGKSNSSPVWTADASVIFFLSNRSENKKMEIHAMPADGGEAYQVSLLEELTKAKESSNCTDVFFCGNPIIEKEVRARCRAVGLAMNKGHTVG